MRHRLLAAALAAALALSLGTVLVAGPGICAAACALAGAASLQGARAPSGAATAHPPVMPCHGRAARAAAPSSAADRDPAGPAAGGCGGAAVESVPCCAARSAVPFAVAASVAVPPVHGSLAGTAGPAPAVRFLWSRDAAELAARSSPLRLSVILRV